MKITINEQDAVDLIAALVLLLGATGSNKMAVRVYSLMDRIDPDRVIREVMREKAQ